MPFIRQKKQAEAKAEKDRPETPRKPANATIDKLTKMVLNGLGRPPLYLRMEVKPITARTYRINVLTSVRKSGDMIASIHRPHSYLATVDDEKITFNPPLVKLYQKVEGPEASAT
jgi:hypothetical protein